MSTETDESKELEAVALDEASETEAAPKKKKFITEKRIEILVAVFLGITALLVAWATWIGSLHSGLQAINFTKSNNLAAEGNAEYNSAVQLYLSDMVAWNTLIDYQTEADVARMNGKEEEAKLYEDKMQYYITNNCSQILADAAGQVDTSKNINSPFEIEGMTDKYFEDANALLKESQDYLEQGMRDNSRGDAYNLVTVIFSLCLFLLGIVGVFKNLPNRVIVLSVAIFGIVAATIFMFTIPLPTDFNFFSYFGVS